MCLSFIVFLSEIFFLINSVFILQLKSGTMQSQYQPIINISTAMSLSPGGLPYQAILPSPPGLCLNMSSKETTTKDPNEARMRRLVKMKTGTGRNWIMDLNPIIVLKQKNCCLNK